MAELSLSSFDTTPQFKLQATCPCKVLDCYDGDTVTVALQLGDGRLARFTVRLLGIDTPERRPKRSRGQPGLAALEKQAAEAAKPKAAEEVEKPTREANGGGQGKSRSRKSTWSTLEA